LAGTLVGRHTLALSGLVLAAAVVYHASVFRHETTHIVGPLIALTDRLTGHVETCRVTLEGATCRTVEHEETLAERGERLSRERQK